MLTITNNAMHTLGNLYTAFMTTVEAAHRLTYLELCSSNYTPLSGMYDALSHVPNLTQLAMRVINVCDIARILRCPRLEELNLKIYENALVAAEVSGLVLLTNLPHPTLRCVRLCLSPTLLRNQPQLLQMGCRPGLSLIVTQL